MNHPPYSVAGTDDIGYNKHAYRRCGFKYGNWGSVSDQHGFVVEAVGNGLPATHPDLSTGGSFTAAYTLAVRQEMCMPTYRLYIYIASSETAICSL